MFIVVVVVVNITVLSLYEEVNCCTNSKFPTQHFVGYTL